MQYTVSIPNVTGGAKGKDDVGNYVTRVNTEVWNARRHVGSQATMFQQPRIGKVVMVKVCDGGGGSNCRWQRGKIADFTPLLPTVRSRDRPTVGLRDYSYTLEVDGHEYLGKRW